jgi:predicted O-methyltransferase YrrM
MYIKGTLRYIQYRLFAKHGKGHGIHSPFVFNLITRVFRNKFNPEVVLVIERIRKKNKKDKRRIIVSDYGAGSGKMKGNLRKVSDIASYSAVPEKYGVLLANLSSEFGRNSVVEFGTSLGVSTLYLAAGNPGAVVYTMEGCPETAAVAGENIMTSGFTNIEQMTGTFDDLLPLVKKKCGTPGLIFIDGDHRKESVIRYFDDITGVADHDTVVVLDDIHSSSGMEEAWMEIRSRSKVTVSIDLYRFGLLFFRKGISCAKYIIRY